MILVAAGALIALAVAVAAGLSGEKQTAARALAKVQLREEILAFTLRKIPDIYRGLVRFNDQILLIDRELERLSEIEAEFPRQKPIIHAERANWTRLQSGLFAALSRIEREVEKIYVTHLVNPDKGRSLIEKENAPLLETVNQAIHTAGPQIRRLRVDKKKTFLDRLKEKLS